MMLEAARGPARVRRTVVAVFVGGTSGIGEYTLKEFTRAVRRPRIYVDRIVVQRRQVNPDGLLTFVQGDISHLRNVDALCKKVQDQEKAITIGFWSAGSLTSGQSKSVYSRTRIISNFLPQLKAATGIRRVISVSTGTTEGEIDFDDFQLLKGGGISKQREHNSSMISLTSVYFATKVPSVSFIHDYPGHVKSGISRGTTGVLKAAFVVINTLGPLLFFKPEKESGDRHLYHLTSERFEDQGGGVDGVAGSGVYSCDADNNEAPEKVENILSRHKKPGAVGRVWKRIQDNTMLILESSSE
ncbi:NAD(P)-binding domain [Cordyceps javanica]|uniref:NAD(P)-binding domain n=1 Tax=Cordyceps javanica TaxID=43265 RepID=A0A545UYH1_9HYPO|nr:NAD(P)-binding domain [Cordyceps javanica]